MSDTHHKASGGAQAEQGERDHADQSGVDQAVVPKAADQGRGVLFSYGNYAGDVLNFELYPWHSPKLTAGIASPADLDGKTSASLVLGLVQSTPFQYRKAP